MTRMRLADFVQAVKVELAEAQRREGVRRDAPHPLPGQKLPSMRLAEVVIEMTIEASVNEKLQGSVGTGKAVEVFVALGSVAAHDTGERYLQKVQLKFDGFGEELYAGEAPAETPAGGGST